MADQTQENLWNQYLDRIKAGTDPVDPTLQTLYQQLSREHQEWADVLRRVYQRGEDPEPDEARRVAAEVKAAVAPAGQLPLQQGWLPCAPLPTDLCRVSPFFPLRQRDMRERPFIRDLVITSTSWGEIRYSGPKLSTYEEDVLLAVLALLDTKRQVTQVEGRSTYTYRGPLLPILRLMGYKKRGGKADYKRVLEALKLLSNAVVELTVYRRTTRGKRKVALIDVSNIVIHAQWKKDQKELSVTINPYFYECFMAGRVTLLQVVERARLNSPVAKALYRFLESHREVSWRSHLQTLASALNLDRDQPRYQLRRLIKQAISELKRHGLLADASGFDSPDIVYLVRPSRKASQQSNLLPKWRSVTI